MTPFNRALVGAIVPNGAKVSPGGMQGVIGIRGIQGARGDRGIEGPQGIQGPSGMSNPFVFLTGPTSLDSTLNGYYLICSGGAWTMDLPAPEVGLTYYIRNDMGIAVGIPSDPITLLSSSGQIDGQSSILLLPQQECRLFSNGTNWRTFGRSRDVVVGTIDVASVANVDIQLPGYRHYEIILERATPASGQWFNVLISTNRGASFTPATGYNRGMLLNTSATMAAYSYASGAAPVLAVQTDTWSSGILWAFPISGLLGYTQGWLNARGNYTWLSQCQVSFNALRFYASTGNIVEMRATVIGRT